MASQAVRFGPFDLDLAQGRLKREGIPVRLQEQPLVILTALLERPGSIVTCGGPGPPSGPSGYGEQVR
jgi:DNA-binding winged helix-turn-helix (wHTH) protein